MQKKHLPALTQTIRLASVSLAIMVLSGCATAPSSVQLIEVLESDSARARILLMPPDIKYYLVTAGGVPEPHAEWTEQARTNFSLALRSLTGEMESDLVVMDPDNLSQKEIEYEELHSTVGLTALTNYFGMLKLPSKNGKFDWSLGAGVSEVAEEYEADYVLFVYYRDYQASGGRVAFWVLAAAAGASMPLGSETGFASLVDLKTGDIVWFNVVGIGSGELRDEQGAAAAVSQLFRDFPGRRVD